MTKSEQKIDQETFNHLVDLAELQLPDDEAEYLLKEMNAQLSAIDQLAEIELGEGTQPASRGVPYPPDRSQGLRKDKVDANKEPDKILSQAPKTSDRYIVVPDIPHTDLE